MISIKAKKYYKDVVILPAMWNKGHVEQLYGTMIFYRGRAMAQIYVSHMNRPIYIETWSKKSVNYEFRSR